MPHSGQTVFGLHLSQTTTTPPPSPPATASSSFTRTTPPPTTVLPQGPGQFQRRPRPVRQVTRQDPTERDNKAGARILRHLQGIAGALPREQVRRGFAPAPALPGGRPGALRGARGALLHETRRLRRPPPTARRAWWTTYPNTLRRKRRFVILVNAYNAMGMKELAADAKKVLDLNLPEQRHRAQQGAG